MHTSPAITPAGQLLSLASALPDPESPLGRRARRLADRLSHGAVTRGARREASALLADLLEATDADLSGYAEDGLLDADFDQ